MPYAEEQSAKQRKNFADIAWTVQFAARMRCAYQMCPSLVYSAPCLHETCLANLPRSVRCSFCLHTPALTASALIRTDAAGRKSSHALRNTAAQHARVESPRCRHRRDCVPIHTVSVILLSSRRSSGVKDLNNIGFDDQPPRARPCAS